MYEIVRVSIENSPINVSNKNLIEVSDPKNQSRKGIDGESSRITAI